MTRNEGPVPVKVIAVIGGIGSGKSAVGRILSGLGCAVIDADRVAREAVQPGRPAYRDIVREFGSGILTADGSIDRGKLAALVFVSEKKRLRLNAITHPRVMERIWEQVAAIKCEGAVRAIAVEVPVPSKELLQGKVDAVWAVRTGKAERIRRAQARGMDERAVLRILDAQMDDVGYEALADRVLTNDGTMDDLEKAVGEALGDLSPQA